MRFQKENEFWVKDTKTNHFMNIDDLIKLLNDLFQENNIQQYIINENGQVIDTYTHTQYNTFEDILPILNMRQKQIKNNKQIMKDLHPEHISPTDFGF